MAVASGSGNRSARDHTSCAVVSALTLDRAFDSWCYTTQCDRPSRWAAAFLGVGRQDGRDHADLAVGAALGCADRPSRHAL